MLIHKDLLSGNGLSPKLLLFSFLGLSALWVTWNIIYNVFFHPLSRFPGPVWGKVTRVPFWITGFTGTQIYMMHSLHEKYGNVVRFCPDELSYTDPQAWKDINGHVKGRSENAKAPGFHLEAGSWPSMMVAETAAEHARARHLFSPGFSDRALKQQEPLFRKYTNLLMRKLHSLNGQPVDMTVMNNLATFDIMAELTFGEPLGLLENSKYTNWVKRVIEAIKVLRVLHIIRYYPLLTKVFNFFEPKWAREAARSHFRYSADRVNRRLMRGSTQPDLWNLLQSEKNDEELSLDEMHANALIFMMAGTETTATLLTAMIPLLVANPDKFAILRAEIRSQAATTQGLCFESLAPLKYLNACIQEGLRIYTPVPVGIPRVISDNINGGQMICGHWVPSGTRAGVHPYAANHLSANFKDPELFAPERWLGDKIYQDDKRDVCQAFSFGPRNCLGQSMAWHEMRMILGDLIANFDMEICPESRGWSKDKKVYILWEKIPLMVRLKPVGH